jgi:DNA polymerase III subunit delta'
VALSSKVRISLDVLPQWREAVLENPYLGLNDWFDYLDAENKQPVIAAEESGDIVRKLSLTTYEGGYKIMIIWMAEKMNVTAANKLLKILEEPPDKTLFLLLVMNEEELLKTIRSRTQLVKINKYKDHEVQEALQVFKKLPADEASKIAYLADGNYNIAQRMLNYDESTSFKAPFRDWMLLCLRFEASKLMEWIDQMSRTGREQQKTFFKYGLQIFRECLMMNFGDPSLIKLYGEELEFVKKFSRFVNGANADKFVEELNKASYHIERNANPKILLLNLSFRMNELLNMKNG